MVWERSSGHGCSTHSNNILSDFGLILVYGSAWCESYKIHKEDKIDCPFLVMWMSKYD